MYEIKLLDGSNGSIRKTPSGTFRLSFKINGKETNLGIFPTQELAEEARRYFINECNYDLDEYKESKYWKELKNIGTNSENYKKKSGVKGISYDTRDKLWQVGIEVTKNGFNLDNTLKRVRKCFSSLENAINFKNYVTELIEKCDVENTKDSDEKYQKLIYIQNQSTKYAKELKANQAEKEARENNSISDSMTEEEFKEIQKWFKNKRGEMNMKKYEIGDKVKLKSGKSGIVEDYDDNYYYIKDDNCNVIKAKKNSISDDNEYTTIYRHMKIVPSTKPGRDGSIDVFYVKRNFDSIGKPRHNTEEEIYRYAGMLLLYSINFKKEPKYKGRTIFYSLDEARNAIDEYWDELDNFLENNSQEIEEYIKTCNLNEDFYKSN